MFLGGFFLELSTGKKTLLAENLAGGHAYVASPDGKRLVYGTSIGGGCADADRLTIANVDGTAARVLPPPRGFIYCGARWSPDGTKLVYQLRKGRVSTDVGNLFVHDLSTGRKTQVTDLELTRAWWWFLSPIVSPDGQRVIFHLPRRSSETTRWDIWSVPVTGGDMTLLLENAAFPLQFPERERIAFVQPARSSFFGSGIAIASSNGAGSRRTLVKADASVFWPRMSPDGSKIAYQDGDSITVVQVSTGDSSKVADGETPEWLDNDTLIVS